MDRPAKNGAQHAADAFQYLAQGVELSKQGEDAEIIDLEF